MNLPTDIAHCPDCFSEHITPVCVERTWRYLCVACGHVTPDRPSIAAIGDDVIWTVVLFSEPSP